MVAMTENTAAQPAMRCGVSKAATSEAELHSLARDLHMRITIINCAALASVAENDAVDYGVVYWESAEAGSVVI